MYNVPAKPRTGPIRHYESRHQVQLSRQVHGLTFFPGESISVTLPELVWFCTVQKKRLNLRGIEAQTSHLIAPPLYELRCKYRHLSALTVSSTSVVSRRVSPVYCLINAENFTARG